MSTIITINGEKKRIDKQNVSLNTLFESLSIKKEGRIAEVNGKLYKGREFDSVRLQSGDNVEIIQFIGGG